MTVTANIDISSPRGRRLVRELEKHKRIVKITSPNAEEIPDGAIPIEQGIEEFRDHLETKFGFDLRNK